MSLCQKVGRDIALRVGVPDYEVVGDAAPAEHSLVDDAFRMFKARISLSSGQGQHVLYRLSVEYQDQVWSLSKRFSEVAALHEVLRHRLTCMPELPSKSAVRQFDMEYLEGRKRKLAAYLQDIAKRRDVLNCPEAQQFFGLPQHAKDFRQGDGNEPTHVAEVQEANFSVNSFAYDAASGYLLLASAERSWTSMVDTKITNIKLPWEPAAKPIPSSQMSLWKQSPVDLHFELQFVSKYTSLISQCALLRPSSDDGLCLCGLSDGTVGFRAFRGESRQFSVGNTLPILKHTAAIVALAVDNDQEWVITASKDNAVIVYDVKKKMIQCEVQTSAPATCMHYCSAKQRLFIGQQNGHVVVWDASILPLQQVCRVPEHSVEPAHAVKINTIDYDDVTGTLFTGSTAGIMIWTVKSSNGGFWMRKAGQIAPMTGKPRSVLWAVSSRELLVGFASGAVVVFDIDTGYASYAWQAHKDEVTSMMWLDAPRRLLTSSAEKKVKIWDFPSLRRTPLEDQPAFAAVAGPKVSVAGKPKVPAWPGGSVRSAGGYPDRGASAAGGLPARDPLAGHSVQAARVDQVGGASVDQRAQAAAQPKVTVAGARPGATIMRSDSGDDLSGWNT